MTETNKDAIRSTIEQLLQKMGFGGNVTITENPQEDGSLTCNIETGKDDSSFLIGQYGANLQALQHLARLLVRKNSDDRTKFILDVNNYKAEKNESLIELARKTAQEALSEKRAIVMKPMSNYERRLIHLELAKNSEVETESIGEGESRKIVVKPSEKF